MQTQRGTSGRVDLERKLAVVDVSEGPRVECELRTGPEAFSLDLQCRVCYSLETLLMRWDTCQDIDEDQNLTTTVNLKLDLSDHVVI